jgi:hypothetical protein
LVHRTFLATFFWTDISGDAIHNDWRKTSILIASGHGSTRKNGGS